MPPPDSRIQITNCHVHTFTNKHVPTGFVNPLASRLLERQVVRRLLLKAMRRVDEKRRGRLTRYAEVLEISYGESQRQVFEKLAGLYPLETRFVILPMDMAYMGAGAPKESLEQQHDSLVELRGDYPNVILFAGVDPRRPGVVASTKDLIENRGFRGIKLYPPLGYHPNHPVLQELYAWAEEAGVPVLSHCSRPGGVSYRGRITNEMRTDPVTGELLPADAKELLAIFTDPETYKPILEKHPGLRVCLAHFGGAGEWGKYLDRPWDSLKNPDEKSWLAKVRDMLREKRDPDLPQKRYPNLWTDISYTVFADDEYAYMLKVLLAEQAIRDRVLFGSDFYVVADANLEERRRAVRLRALVGEDVFRLIAETNPREYLGETTLAAAPATPDPTSP